MTTPNGLTVITTHINADFDAMASMLAAQKLYPDAVVVFPGSQERNLRNFFIDSMVYLFNMADMKDIDFERVKRLVLVDTRQANRIGGLARLLERKDVDVHVYDHHPPMKNDIHGQHEVHRLTGATVSILTGIIRRRNIPVSAEEATIMCLGIYEDTGSFTFPSTTVEDFEAAAYLLSKGADLNIVSTLIAREITPEQVGLLNDMIQAVARHNVNGLEVVITSVTREHYVPDFAFLVQKMMRMEDLNVLFALGCMGEKIYLVARSRIPEVDVGAIVTELGGGGHNFAAAATIRGKTLTQAQHELLERLYRLVKARRQAKDLMSSPPISVSTEVSCREANNLLTRYNINVLLVVRPQTETTDGSALAGYISRQVIEKALYHKLGEVPVREYMTTEFATVSPEADLVEIQDKIIENKQRLLPVVEGNLVKGVITRTDLLDILVHQSSQMSGRSRDPLQAMTNARTRKIVKFMKERLTPGIIGILNKIGEVADQLGYGAYVVGGFVRDLFLYRLNEDLDIVIEGNGIVFAKEFGRIAGARTHTHEKFGTAVIIFPDGFKIDVASARMEYYRFPAALPVVETSSIKLDLYRRDFTINTLAIQINASRFGTLIDFFNALRDIKDKAIRVLHNLSLVEDPTRVFRAIRFEQRFGFTIGKLTASLIENAISMDFFKRLSGRRVFTEIRLILEEENPIRAIVRLNDFDLLKVIHPSIVLDKNLIMLFNATRKVLSWTDLLFLEESYMKWVVYFLALIRQCDRRISEDICTRFELPPRLFRIVCEERFEADRCLSKLERYLPKTNSALSENLRGFKTELILYMMAAARKKPVKKAISLYFTHLRFVQPTIGGRDLKHMGLFPGPVFRQILDRVLQAKLDGKLKTPADELTLAHRLVLEHRAVDSP